MVSVMQNAKGACQCNEQGFSHFGGLKGEILLRFFMYKRIYLQHFLTAEKPSGK